jgi:rod shape-determining protein MreB
VNTKNTSVATNIVNAVLSHVRNNKDPLIATPFSISTANPFAARPAPQFTDGGADPALDTESGESILLVGLDWGASKTCIKASFVGSEELVIDECIPTVVGYAKAGNVSGVLPDDATTLFGREALTHRRHLHLTSPTLDSAASADFARHIRSRLKAIPAAEIRAVIAVPAMFDGVARENVRTAIAEHLDCVILLPQPFLAAVGYRDESRLLDADYCDPMRQSILIDLGASASSICLALGYYPTAEEQTMFPFGGNHVDDLLRAAILENHPEAELSPITVRHLKEQHSFVGEVDSPVMAEVAVAGKIRTLDITAEINAACTELLTRTFDALKTLLGSIPSDAVSEVLQNVILSGGGSRIKNIGPEFERLLTAEGYDGAQALAVGEDSKHLVAMGALKAARQARDHQWLQVSR